MLEKPQTRQNNKYSKMYCIVNRLVPFSNSLGEKFMNFEFFPSKSGSSRHSKTKF